VLHVGSMVAHKIGQQTYMLQLNGHSVDSWSEHAMHKFTPTLTSLCHQAV